HQLGPRHDPERRLSVPGTASWLLGQQSCTVQFRQGQPARKDLMAQFPAFAPAIHEPEKAWRERSRPAYHNVTTDAGAETKGLETCILPQLRQPKRRAISQKDAIV